MEKINCSGIDVYYQNEHNGGGIKFFKEYVQLLNGRKYKNVMEFCSGPGFIGFALMGAGIADYLTLIDVNPDILPGIQKTIINNKLQDRVHVLIGDGLQALENNKIDYKFELVVSNPPHIDVLNPKTGPIPYKDRPIIYSDPGFKIHRDFFKNVDKYLSPSGEILFIENGLFSNREEIFGENKYPSLDFLPPPHSELDGKYYIYARLK